MKTMAYQVQRLSRILGLFGVMVGPGRCYQRDRAADATKTNSNNIVQLVEHDGARDDDAATPEDTFDRSSKYKRGAARAGPSSDSFQAEDAEVDFASSGEDELKMSRRSISDPVSTAQHRTAVGDTAPDARTGPHIPNLLPVSSTAAGGPPRNNTSANPSPSMSSSRSAASAEDEHKGDIGSGTGIAGPVDHRASPSLMLAEDVGSRSASGIQGSASESRLSQPVRTTSPEDVIAQAHDQRKGPGYAGMLGKYATHMDTINTSFSFNSSTIGSARDPGWAPDSQMLRRGGGSKHQRKRSTTKVQTSRSTKRKTRENEKRGPERDQELASSAGVLREQASSEEATTTTTETSPHCANSGYSLSNPDCSPDGLWQVKNPHSTRGGQQAILCDDGEPSGCTQVKCCDGRCDASLCVGDHELKDDAADERCTGRLCAADDCCVCSEKPHCVNSGYSVSKDCQEGNEPSSFWTLKKPWKQQSICCNGNTCTQEECCSGTCHESLCGAAQSLSEAAENDEVRCTGKLCDADDCCVPPTNSVTTNAPAGADVGAEEDSSGLMWVMLASTILTAVLGLVWCSFNGAPQAQPSTDAATNYRY